MFTHRLTRAGAVALAIAAAAAPSAVARPADGPDGWKLPAGFETADTRDAVPSNAQQDFRNPDTVDYANGRGTYNAPDVVVVEAPAPVAQPTSGGIDWQDVGLGAGSLLAIALTGAAGVLLIVRRRAARSVVA